MNFCFGLILFSVFLSVNVYAQNLLAIERQAAEIFLLLSGNHQLPSDEINNLKSILNYSSIREELEEKYKISKERYDKLKIRLDCFESEMNRVSADSALVLFNIWYLNYCNTFYEYLTEHFFSSPKTKILFFSTSMSCHCTLEMCKNQLIDILKFIKENEYDYLVVDSYEDDELQIKYETLFAPSVIVLGSKNEVLHKIEYDEKMIDKLKTFLKGEK